MKQTRCCQLRYHSGCEDDGSGAVVDLDADAPSADAMQERLASVRQGAVQLDDLCERCEDGITKN